LTNTQNYSIPPKKEFLNKITVLACMTFESFG